MGIKDEAKGIETITPVERLRELHPDALVAFCAAMTGDPTNNRADCLAAKAATTNADGLDRERKRVLVIYSRYQGLVFAMADHDGKPRWINKWQRNGWKNADKKPVVHQEIYKALIEAEQHRSISWQMADKDVYWLVQLHQQVHDEAERVARAATTNAA